MADQYASKYIYLEVVRVIQQSIMDLCHNTGRDKRQVDNNNYRYQHGDSESSNDSEIGTESESSDSSTTGDNKSEFDWDPM